MYRVFFFFFGGGGGGGGRGVDIHDGSLNQYGMDQTDPFNTSQGPKVVLKGSVCSYAFKLK